MSVVNSPEPWTRRESCTARVGTGHNAKGYSVATRQLSEPTRAFELHDTPTSTPTTSKLQSSLRLSQSWLTPNMTPRPLPVRSLSILGPLFARDGLVGCSNDRRHNIGSRLANERTALKAKRSFKKFSYRVRYASTVMGSHSDLHVGS